MLPVSCPGVHSKALWGQNRRKNLLSLYSEVSMSLLGDGEATLLRKNEQNQQLQAGAGVLIPQELDSQGDFHNALELEF